MATQNLSNEFMATVVRYSSDTYPFYPTAGVPERQYEDMSFNRIRDMTAGRNRFGRHKPDVLLRICAAVLHKG